MSTADLINRKLSRELSEGVANMAWRLSWCASRAREMEGRGEFCGIEAYENLDRAYRKLKAAMEELEPFARAYDEMIGEAA